MWLGQVKTKMGNAICHRRAVSPLLAKKLAVHQLICSVVFGTLLLAACTVTQTPPSLSVSSVPSSSDIVVQRLAAAPKAKSTIGGSSAVHENNGIIVNSATNDGNVPQQKPGTNLSVDSQYDVAASVIDTIIWQIQTGPAPPSPVDPVVPEGQDPSLSEDALGAAFALLSSQVQRCNDILKRLSLNPVEEDNFIDEDLTMEDHLKEIILSFKEISKKNFIFNSDQFSNKKKITKSIEIVYGLRNFIGNANKFAKKNIFINLKSDSEITEITLEDDGSGFPRDIISKIGEPYLKSNYSKDKSKEGLGLGLFIGKTLLEKNFASVNCRNSKTRSGAEINIRWKNKELFNI